MSIDIKVPAMGESVTEATVARWFKKEGDAVKRDEPVLELETDKVTVEVPAPADGAIESISVQEGATVQVGTILGAIAEGQSGRAQTRQRKRRAERCLHRNARSRNPRRNPRSRTTTRSRRATADAVGAPHRRRNRIESGARCRHRQGRPRAERRHARRAGSARRAARATPVHVPSGPRANAAREERVTMRRLRNTIALRLKESQNTAAQLTTFNEVDMSHVMALRAEYKESFEKKHGVRLGFMGFFVKACIAALKEIPTSMPRSKATTSSTRIITTSASRSRPRRGLSCRWCAMPIRCRIAGIEAAITDFGLRARDGKLKLEDLQGGTFTISNGGVFGSLMSTPILNAPQSGILGMHKIQPRPIAIDDKVEIRPMMYLALSYDHRLVDGREAVTFLVRVKENLEDPQRLLLDI